MNPPVRAYSSFPALLLFFAAVTLMDLDQTATLHRKKLGLMQEYAQAVQLQKQVATQARWVSAMQHDLLRLAPGDAEASAVVTELNLRPRAGK